MVITVCRKPLVCLAETNNGGFSNTLDNVANAYGVDKQRMIDDLDTYVMATADIY